MSSSGVSATAGDNVCVSDGVADATLPAHEKLVNDGEETTSSEEGKVLWLTGALGTPTSTETKASYPDNKVRTKKLPG